MKDFATAYSKIHNFLFAMPSERNQDSHPNLKDGLLAVTKST